MKDLNTIDSSGSEKIQSNNLKINFLTININGADEGNLTNFNANTLKILISGVGRLNISDNANNQDINSSGASNTLETIYPVKSRL